MEYKILGKTKLKVPPLSFGGGPLRVISQSEAIELILKARELGINLIDVDKLHEENEKKVGYALKQLKQNMIIATKSFATTKEKMTQDIQDSINKLGINSIDIYQMHMIRDEKDLAKRLEGSLVSLKKARTEGKIKFIGFSGHHIPTLIKAVKTNEFDTALIPYNLGHTLADELLDVAKEHDVGTIIMKPLGGGFLVDPKFDEPHKQGAEFMTTENALKIILADKRIDTTLIGFQHIKEIEEAARIANKKIELTQDEIQKIKNKMLEFLGDDYCRNCKYCTPCNINESLDIVEILKLEGYYSKYGYKEKSKFIYNHILDVQADACVNCGECEKKCPYNLPIIHFLSQAHMHLSQKLEDEEFENKEKKQLIDLIKKLNEDLKKKKKIIHDLSYKIKMKKLGGSISEEERELLEAIHKRDVLIREKDHKIQDILKELIHKEGELKQKEKELEKCSFEITKRKVEIIDLQAITKQKEQDEEKLSKQIEKLGKELKGKNKELIKKLQEKEKELEEYRRKEKY